MLFDKLARIVHPICTLPSVYQRHTINSLATIFHQPTLTSIPKEKSRSDKTLPRISYTRRPTKLAILKSREINPPVGRRSDDIPTC